MEFGVEWIEVYFADIHVPALRYFISIVFYSLFCIRVETFVKEFYYLQLVSFLEADMDTLVQQLEITKDFWKDIARCYFVWICTNSSVSNYGCIFGKQFEPRHKYGPADLIISALSCYICFS
jgi:hypothetical protein